MDGKNDLPSGVNIRGDDPPSFFTVSRPAENVQTVQQQPKAPNMAAFTHPVHLPGAPVFTEVKKKRGRPRGYGSDGKPRARGTLSPMPISASIPIGGDFSGWKQPRGRSVPVIKKAHKLEFENLGDRLSNSAGTNFRTHVLTVNAGEDVLMKIISFSRKEPHAICVLSASGSISNVTLRQPSSPGGTLIYQGHFEIVSLSGSFTPTDNGAYNSRSGGISVVLSEPDGRVLGGGLAGILVARSSVQVVLGSFLVGHQPKNQKNNIVAPVIPAVVNPVPQGGYGVQKVNLGDDDGEDDDDDDDDDDGNDSPTNLEFSG